MFLAASENPCCACSQNGISAEALVYDGPASLEDEDILYLGSFKRI